MTGRRVGTGIAWLVAGEMIFVATWCAIKYLGSRLPLFEIVFFRALLSLLVLFPLAGWRLKSFRGKNLHALFLRAIFGFLAMFSSFYAMIHMKMGNASTLINTMPLFVAVLSPLILREPFSRRQFVFVLASFAGIALILKPDPRILEGPALLALFAGLMSAMAMIYIRRLTATEPTILITLFFTAFCAAASLPLAVRGFIWPTAGEWFWLCFIGFAITFAQLFMTQSYRFGHASTIAPFTYSAVIGAYIAGLALFGEIPDLWSLAGAVIIVGGGIGVMLTAPAGAARRAIPPQTPS